MAVETNTPILIVNDQAPLIRILRNLLHQLGFENVDDAMDGTQALAMRYGARVIDQPWVRLALARVDLAKMRLTSLGV